MAQFDVYVNRGPSAEAYPFYMDVQANVLAALETRMVVPLSRRLAFRDRILPVLTPRVDLGDEQLLVLVQELAARDRRDLVGAIANLADRRAEILAAFDLLFTGA